MYMYKKASNYASDTEIYRQCLNPEMSRAQCICSTIQIRTTDKLKQVLTVLLFDSGYDEL